MTAKKSIDFPGFSVEFLETVDSTNAEATRRVSSGLATPNKSVIIAEKQTAGRGRREREWFSPVGNLYCSLILQPPRDMSEWAQVSFVAALAIHGLLSEFCGTDQTINTKWPNDVLINQKKVSGILLETETSPSEPSPRLIVGMGINIAHHPENTQTPAVSLNALGYNSLNIEDVTRRLLNHFDGWYDTWLATGFRGLKAPWLERTIGIGKPIVVRLEKLEISGIFAGINDEGALCLDDHGETRFVAAGDVFFPDMRET